MKIQLPIILLLFLVLSCQHKPTAEPDIHNDSGKTDLVLVDEEKELKLEILGTEGSFLEVKLSNATNDTVRLWETWNSWGYYNLSFELKTDFDMLMENRSSSGNCC